MNPASAPQGGNPSHALLQAVINAPQPDSTGTSLTVIHFQGQPLVLKLWPLRSFLKRWRARSGSSQAGRHVRGALALEQAGIRAARPAARGLVRILDTNYEWLLMEHVTGPTLLDVLQESRQQTLSIHDWAIAAAELVALVHNANLFNRDPKPSNILVESASPIKLCFIDTVGIRRRGIGLSTLARMLSSLVLEPTGCGCPPGTRTMARGWRAACQAVRPPLDRDERHLVWRMVSMVIARHGDPTPKVPPRHKAIAPRPDGKS